MKSNQIISKDNKNVSKSYSDYSTASPDSYRSLANGKGGVKFSFPVKLFQMLEHIDIAAPELAPIISWQPHGRSFRVHDVEKFKECILPEYFNKAQYPSFTRQLNLWRFKRIKGRGPDCGSYFHEMFLRDRPFLCHGMNRTAVIGFGKKRQGEEPKFYSMDPLPPTTKNLEVPEPHTETNICRLPFHVSSCDHESNERRSSDSWSPITGVPPPLTKEEIRQIRDVCSRIK